MFHIHGQASNPPLLFPIEFCRMQILSGGPAMHVNLSADLTSREVMFIMLATCSDNSEYKLDILVSMY